jgi:hypothetical protein
MAVRNRNAYSGARRHALDRYIELIPETAPLETAHVVRMMDKFFKNWNYLVYFIPEFSPATLRVKHGD